MVGGLQVAGWGLVPAPRARGVELVAATVQLQGRGAHDAGVRVEVIPLAPVTQPAAHLGTVGCEEVPAVGKAFPAGAHRTRRSQVVPRAVHRCKPHAHDAGVRVEVIPLAPVAQPAANECSRGSQEEPVGAVATPAGGHVAAVIEVVASAPDPHPLGGGVSTVGSPPPPADRIVHPRASSGLIGHIHRRRFVAHRRGLGRAVFIARCGGGRLGRVRGLGAGRGRRRGRRSGLGRGGAVRDGLRRLLVPGFGAGLRG